MKLRNLEVVTKTNSMQIDKVIEYVCGYFYFYLRMSDGSTLSFNRSDIIEVKRKLEDGEYKTIHLKKVKTIESSKRVVVKPNSKAA